jgi:hypothetical protein
VWILNLVDRFKPEYPQLSRRVCLLWTAERPRGFRLADLVRSVSNVISAASAYLILLGLLLRFRLLLWLFAECLLRGVVAASRVLSLYDQFKCRVLLPRRCLSPTDYPFIPIYS